MVDRRDFGRAVARGLGGVALALTLTACARSAATTPTPNDAARLHTLEAEVLRLSAKVNALEDLLQQERRSTLAVRNRQSPRGAPETTPTTLEPNTANAVRAEAELRLAYKALMRAIERLDVGAEEKEALKSHLRPTRALDHENPWSVAEY
jgi:hypothetical protein